MSDENGKSSTEKGNGVDSVQPTLHECVDQALQVEQDLEEVQEAQPRNRVAVQNPKPVKRQRTDTSLTNQKLMHRAPVQDPGSGLCFGCGQPGHFRRHCPKKAAFGRHSPPPHAAPVQAPGSGVCFGCGQPGHVKRNCPKAEIVGRHPLPPQSEQYQQQRQNNQGNQRQGQQAQGKAFAIGHVEIDALTPNDAVFLLPIDESETDPTLEEFLGN